MGQVLVVPCPPPRTSPGVCNRGQKSRKDTQHQLFPEVRRGGQQRVQRTRVRTRHPPLLTREFSRVQHREPALFLHPPPTVSVSEEGRGRGSWRSLRQHPAVRGDGGSCTLRAWPGGWGPGWFPDLETRCNWQLPEVSAAWPSKRGQAHGSVGLWAAHEIWPRVCGQLRVQSAGRGGSRDGPWDPPHCQRALWSRCAERLGYTGHAVTWGRLAAWGTRACKVLTLQRRTGGWGRPAHTGGQGALGTWLATSPSGRASARGQPRCH